MDNIQKEVSETEIVKCAESFTYFCERYLKVYHPCKGLIPFILYDYQKGYINHILSNRYSIGKKFRQGGFSTLNMAFLTWRLLFKHNEVNAIVVQDEQTVIAYNKLLTDLLSRLPESFQSNYTSRNLFDCSKTGSSLLFINASNKMGRGCGLNYAFIEEAAFIKDMDKFWKSFYPCLHGNCVVTSTPNMASGWFYETYMEALTGHNAFKVFTCSYTQHPYYKNKELVENARTAMGETAWRQEVLALFLPIDARDSDQQHNEESIEVASSVQCSKSDKSEYNCYLFDLIEAQDSVEEIKPQAYQFKNLTDSERKDLIDKYHAKSKPIDHAKFDDFKLQGSEDLAEFWTDVADLYDSYSNVRDYWIERNKSKEESLIEVLEKIDEEVDPDMLLMAGVIDLKECEEMSKVKSGRPDLVILRKVSDCFENMKLTLDGENLCVNKCPTKIKEDDIRDLYNSLFSLVSYDEAIESAVNIIVEKLSPIFTTSGRVA